MREAAMCLEQVLAESKECTKCLKVALVGGFCAEHDELMTEAVTLLTTPLAPMRPTLFDRQQRVTNTDLGPVRPAPLGWTQARVLFVAGASAVLLLCAAGAWYMPQVWR